MLIGRKELAYTMLSQKVLLSSSIAENILYRGMIVANTGMTIVIKIAFLMIFFPLNSILLRV